MKHVLIITYHFPPFRTSGVYRHLKFSKYLGNFNWKPWIITCRNPSKRRFDRSLIKDIPREIPVHHTHTFEPSGLQDRLIQFIYKTYPKCGKTTNERPALFNAINKLLRTFLLIPDDMIGWIPHTLAKAHHLIQNEDISVLCTTSPPHSTHLVGLLLKQITGKPWIADFRDPWTNAFMKESLLNALPWRQKLEIHMERKVLQSSNMVIAASPGIKRHFLQRHGSSLDEKIAVVTNGFDDADFLHMETTSQERTDFHFVITHIGIVYPGKSRSFLTTLRRLIDKNRDFRRDVMVKFVGHPSQDNMNLIAELNLEHYVSIEGFHDHDLVISDMLGSDLLLLMVGKENHWIPGKLFEYIRAQKPIFVIGDYGEAAKIALKSGLGVLVSDENGEEIERKLLECYLNRSRPPTLTDTNYEYIKSFDRVELTRRFAQLLEEAIERQA